MKIGYTATALRQLEQLPTKVRERIVVKMYFYRTQKNPLAFAKHLSGYRVWRFRVGDYRVLCEAKEDTLCVIGVARRDDAYRDL